MLNQLLMNRFAKLRGWCKIEKRTIFTDILHSIFGERF